MPSQPWRCTQGKRVANCLASAASQPPAPPHANAPTRKEACLILVSSVCGVCVPSCSPCSCSLTSSTRRLYSSVTQCGGQRRTSAHTMQPVYPDPFEQSPGTATASPAQQRPCAHLPSGWGSAVPPPERPQCALWPGRPGCCRQCRAASPARCRPERRGCQPWLPRAPRGASRAAPLRAPGACRAGAAAGLGGRARPQKVLPAPSKLASVMPQHLNIRIVCSGSFWSMAASSAGSSCWGAPALMRRYSTYCGTYRLRIVANCSRGRAA